MYSTADVLLSGMQFDRYLLTGHCDTEKIFIEKRKKRNHHSKVARPAAAVANSILSN